MNDKELAALIKSAYDDYFLWKAMQTSESAFRYEGEVTKLIKWLINGRDSSEPQEKSSDEKI